MVTKRRSGPPVASHDLAELTRAWQALESRVPVGLRAISSQRHYRAMARFVDRLLDEVGDDESHPLCDLLDVAGALVDDYEEHTAAALSSA